MGSVRRSLLLLLLLTWLSAARALGVALDPSRPTQMHRAPSGPGGKSAWIITAAGHNSGPSAERRRPPTLYTASGHQGATLPMVSFGTGTLHPVSSASNEVHNAADWRRPVGGPKRVPPPFTITSRPFGLASGSVGSSGQPAGAAGMYGPAGGYHTPTRRPPRPETTMAWVNSPDGYTSVENQRVPSYSLGCKEGQKCSFVISVPTQDQQSDTKPYDRQSVQNYLSNYEAILEQARNVTSNYLVQKLEPDTRFPTPMEAYQRDQQLSLTAQTPSPPSPPPPPPPPPRRPTVEPSRKPSVAPPIWATARPPAGYPFSTRQQGYVTLRPTYVHTSLSMGPSSGVSRQKAPPGQGSGPGLDYTSGHGSKYGSGHGSRFGPGYGSRHGLPSDLERRPYTTAVNRPGGETSQPEADRYRPRRPAVGRHPFDDDEQPLASAQTSIYARLPGTRPEPYPNVSPDSGPYPERGPYGRPLDRFRGPVRRGSGSVQSHPADHHGLRHASKQQQAASPPPSDSPRYPAGGFSSRYSAEHDTRTHHSGESHDTRYPGGSTDIMYRPDSSSSRYPSDGTRYHSDRSDTRYPPRSARPYSENEVLEPARPGTSEYYSSMPPPYTDRGTLPPVILYRSDRQLLKTSDAIRSSRQLVRRGEGGGNRAENGSRRERGRLQWGGRQEAPGVNSGGTTTSDRNRVQTTSGDSNWLGDSADADNFGAAKSVTSVKLRQPEAQGQPTAPRRHFADRKPLDKIPLTGKVFKAHLKSGPITFVTSDANENQATTRVGDKNPVSRNIDGAAIITTVDGQRKFPNILALAPENLRRNPGFHLPDWTPPPPQQPAAHNYRGQPGSESYRAAATLSARRPAASEFQRVTAPLPLHRRIGVAPTRLSRAPRPENSVQALLATLLPALMG